MSWRGSCPPCAASRYPITERYSVTVTKEKKLRRDFIFIGFEITQASSLTLSKFPFFRVVVVPAMKISMTSCNEGFALISSKYLNHSFPPDTAHFSALRPDFLSIAQSIFVSFQQASSKKKMKEMEKYEDEDEDED